MSFLDVLGGLLRVPDPRPIDVVDAEIAEELAFHIDARTEENIAAGMDPAAARRDAEARFGDIQGIRRSCRWVRLGERIMLHRIHFVVTLLLLIATGFAVTQIAELRIAMSSLPSDPLMDSALFSRGSPIVVGIGDTLRMEDFGSPGSLEAEEVVAADGQALFPEIGWVEVVGLTRQELEVKLTALYAPYYEAPPDIKVRVRKFYETRVAMRDAWMRY